MLAIGFAASAALQGAEVVAALPALEDGFGNPIAGQGGGADRAVQQPPGVMVLIAELRERQAHLNRREAEIEERHQLLEALEQRLRVRLDEIGRAQQKLERTAVVVDDAAGRDVRHLAEMYQQMKPKQAGAIFDKMAPSFAAGFLSEMRPAAAALVLANMTPDHAYAVSLLLAGRNLDRPEAR